MNCRTWAEIDLTAIRDNVAVIQQAVGAQRKVLVPVKADGYGHGAVAASRAALAGGAAMVGVAGVDEAIALRTAGIAMPILVLGSILPEEAAACVSHHVTATVANLEVAHALDSAASVSGIRIPVHVKIDVGMGRIGCWHETARAFVEQVTAFPALTVEGIYTHFPDADDEDRIITAEQAELFAGLVAELRRNGTPVPLVHAANSAAVIEHPQAHFGMVRPGITVYGALPAESVRPMLPLRPALALRTRVSYLKWVEPGRRLSYGGIYQTPHRSLIATLSVGYADGYPRALSNRAEVLIHGRRCPIRGRVCMDQCLADVTEVLETRLGDVATLIGADGDERIRLEEVATWGGTIPHEITARIGARVVREYVDLSAGK